jgi:MFS family permease
VFAESWDSRRAMLVTKSLMAFISALIFLVQLLELHNLYSLLASSIALGLLSAFHHPVRLVFISLVVPRPYLASAVGMNSVSWNVSRIIGPGVAGVTIYLLGPSETFGIATLLYLPLIVCLWFMDLQPRESDNGSAESFFDKIIDGAAVVIGNPLIFSTLCLVFLNSFFVRGALEIQPAIVGQILDGESASLAIVTAAAGIGSLIASGWIGLGYLNKSRIESLLWPMVLAGIFITAALHFFVDIVPISLIFVMTGFTATLVGIGAQTLIQLEVDESYRARVMTWWSTISFGSLVFGGILIGFLGDIIGIDDAVIIMMLGGTAATLSLLIWRRKA